VFLAVQSFGLNLPDFVMFFMSLDRKFNEDSKNVLTTVIFSLQVGFTGDFVPDCSYKLCFWHQILTPIFSLTVPISRRRRGEL